ncbi:NUDIX domain-containing protein, partial [Rhodococcus sp. NPDC058514]|uniref:NUDIX domain-containing protein n=1 Tax=Rhodococcus sp. NPDC058514 TaxID=3346532 RepID=UPI003667143D
MDLSTPKPSDEDPRTPAPPERGPALTRDQCASRLGSFERTAVPPNGARRAAVALALIADGSGTRLLLTRRPPKMRAHAGQFALPGGSVDPGESPEQSAVRELAEELGVRAQADAVVGALHHNVTPSRIVITPLV